MGNEVEIADSARTQKLAYVLADAGGEKCDIGVSCAQE